VDANDEVNLLQNENIVPLVADVTAEGSADKAVELALTRFGKLDVLVNNAGRILYKPIVE